MYVTSMNIKPLCRIISPDTYSLYMKERVMDVINVNIKLLDRIISPDTKRQYMKE